MTTCLELFVVYFLSYTRMGTVDEESTSVKTKANGNKGYFQYYGCRHEERVSSEFQDSNSKITHSKHTTGRPSPCQFHTNSRQYRFNPSKYVWSTGLYCTIQEDLNLNQWRFFNNCKLIWEKAEEKSRKKSVKSVRFKSAYSKVDAVRCLSTGRGGGERLDFSGTHKASLSRDTATSPHRSWKYEEPLSDLSMSLEPISSSSFHSSSDCEGDTFT